MSSDLELMQLTELIALFADYAAYCYWERDQGCGASVEYAEVNYRVVAAELARRGYPAGDHIQVV